MLPGVQTVQNMNGKGGYRDFAPIACHICTMAPAAFYWNIFLGHPVYLNLIFPALLKTLASCQERIEDCGTLATGSSSQDLRDERVTNEITQCKKSAEIFLTGFVFFILQL